MYDELYSLYYHLDVPSIFPPRISFFFFIVFLVILAFISLVGSYKFYKKCGRSGFWFFFPLIGTYVLYRIVGRSRMHSIGLALLHFVPIVNIYTIYKYLAVPIAKMFNKSNTFAFILLTITNFGFVYLGFDEMEHPNEEVIF